jgi:hypothetical protein
MQNAQFIFISKIHVYNKQHRVSPVRSRREEVAKVLHQAVGHSPGLPVNVQNAEAKAVAVAEAEVEVEEEARWAGYWR